MLLDYEVLACSRRCAASGEPISSGAKYFSVLLVEASQTIRKDYSEPHWRGPPDEAIAWWQSQVGEGVERAKLAPQDVLINLFEELAQQPEEGAFRTLLGLLMLRRRILRLVETRRDPALGEVLQLECRRRNTHYELVTVLPAEGRAAELQQRMIELLYGDDSTDEEPT
jgi:hypothetical protein